MEISPQRAQELLASSNVIYTAKEVDAAVARMANEINAALGDAQTQTAPIMVVVVLRGAVVFAGHLLPQLSCAMEVDSVDATRYANNTHGGEVCFRALPAADVAGRTILLIDDILDEGVTLAAIRDKLLAMRARKVVIAVLTEKLTGKPKPLAADFVGLTLPNRYVFGFGMDVHGYWRNLPAIHALKE